MDARERTRMVGIDARRACRRAALGTRSQRRAPNRARAVSTRLRSGGIRMDRRGRRRGERAHFPAQIEKRGGAASGGVQFHAGRAPQLQRGRAARRGLARAAQQRRGRLWRQRGRQFRCGRSGAGPGAGSRTRAHFDAAAARMPSAQARQERGGSKMSGSGKMGRSKAAVPTAPVRAVIEAVMPAVDGGRFPIKRVLGEEVVVEADCFADGHDQLACLLLYRHDSKAAWESVPMVALGNDRWRAAFTVERIGAYRYTVTAWVDAFLSWRHDFARRVDAEDLLVAAQVGAALIDGAASRAKAGAKRRLAAWAKRLRNEQDPAVLATLALDEDLFSLAKEYPDRSFAFTHPVELSVHVDRDRARYSTWYELFPRSFGPTRGAHGTFQDCEAVLAYVAAMGFDVLYLPPVHPIGRERRKGPNNSLITSPSDVGSPWAIGAREGGHTAVHPELGTLADFRELIAHAGKQGLEVALDIA